MTKSTWLLAILVCVVASEASGDESTDLAGRAQRFFQGVYGGDPTVVDELASDEVLLSYPIIQELFDKPALRGRESVRNFVMRFAGRWTDTDATIHEVIAEDNRVVLVWSFQARLRGSTSPSPAREDSLYAWGGITFYRFDSDGRIVAEIGEESTPGPMARLAAAKLRK